MLVEDGVSTANAKPVKVTMPKVRTPSASGQRHSSRGGQGKVTSLVPRKRDNGADGEITKNDSSLCLSKEKLSSILKGYGEYPAKYRMFIWRSLLKLPENHKAYSSLLDKGTHTSYLTLHEKYPMKSRKLLRVLQRALSALAHWAAIFGETQYLPGLVFPFVKMFQNNQLVTFEFLATILCKYICRPLKQFTLTVMYTSKLVWAMV